MSQWCSVVIPTCKIVAEMQMSRAVLQATPLLQQIPVVCASRPAPKSRTSTNSANVYYSCSNSMPTLLVYMCRLPHSVAC